MAALKDIKRKISAVQKTRQITKAMNMVAAAKFKSSQVRMENFRPYAVKLMEVINSLALRVDMDTHPLLAVREPKRAKVICMTSDRGLCGAFNSGIIKATEKFLIAEKAKNKEVALIPVGRKGRDFFRKKVTVERERVDVMSKFTMDLAVKIGEDFVPQFINAEYDELYIIYNEFRNVSQQKPTVVRLLPLPSIGKEEDVDSSQKVEYIYEPSEEVLLDTFLRMYINVIIYRALLETNAGENGARMAAMDNATKNCEDLISSMTLKFNKVRQSAITAELMDIVGGTEALSKSG
ncbi:MAG: ATP synthase F1 subunit gamma [Deltaproteobacteria bacterium]|nr:ATP synthase F1 subunit gamma [Deltaproteobacteria bacterium]